MQTATCLKLSDSYYDQFLNSLNAILQLLREGGVENESLSSRASAFFRNSGQDFQIATIKKANDYLGLIQDLKLQSVSLSDTQGCLWRIFGKNSWTLESDLLSLIKETDVVEIYLPDNTQLYRNANFFKCTSYSISDLLVFPWSELVEHGPKPSQQIFEIGKQIFLNQSAVGTKFRIEPYLAKERYSKDQLTAKLESKFLSPIRSKISRQNEAALVVWDIEVLGMSDIHKPNQVGLDL